MAKRGKSPRNEAIVLDVELPAWQKMPPTWRARDCFWFVFLSIAFPRIREATQWLVAALDIPVSRGTCASCTSPAGN